MPRISWSKYPQVAAYEWGKKWLEYLVLLDYAQNTIDGYGLDLALFLDVALIKGNFDPIHARIPDVIGFISVQRSRPNFMPGALDGAVICNNSIRRSLAALSSFFDFLIDSEVRTDNPVVRRRTAAGGYRKALVPPNDKLPWIPDELEWQRILDDAVDWPVRDRLMLLLEYDGALRVSELTGLELPFFDFAYRTIELPSDLVKGRRSRVVAYGDVTAKLLKSYLRHRGGISSEYGPLFLSESKHLWPLHFLPAFSFGIMLGLKLIERGGYFSAYCDAVNILRRGNYIVAETLERAGLEEDAARVRASSIDLGGPLNSFSAAFFE